MRAFHRAPAFPFTQDWWPNPLPNEHRRPVLPTIRFDRTVVGQYGNLGISAALARLLAKKGGELVDLHVALAFGRRLA
jgi:hypothetical protein